MTSPTLIADPAPSSTAPRQLSRRVGLPALLFVITLLSTTSVGMRYMYNFRLGRPPLASDSDVLPFGWVLLHLDRFASGLPFSLTLIAILLAHEFGHYFACRSFGIDATLPYLLPAPSLSGSFGAVIRLRSRVRSRSALLVIGAMGPIAGFAVALATLAIGLALSHYSPVDIVPRVQAPLILTGLHRLLSAFRGELNDPARSIFLLIPHPMLTASWMGILITALNLIPAGQLDGGHILYAVSPAAHRVSSRLVVAALFLLGVFYWSGWILWGIILLMPGMRHPIVPEHDPPRGWQFALVPICLVIFLLAGTYEPFKGYSLLHLLEVFPHRYK
jgi:membrane-associated protease RseP (regulator of RpoE activity)